MIHYFAYGSNMCSKRLQSRVPSAVKIVSVSVPGYKLFFHKRGEDGSGKCNIREDDRSVVHGIVYQMVAEEKEALDRIEGPGYRTTALQVKAQNRSLEVFTYVAEQNYICESIRPFSWYKSLVIAGAREHGLPHRYIEKLKQVKAVMDPNRVRAKKQLSILE